MPGDKQREWFEAAWADREERLYALHFGNIGEGIYPLGPDSFSGMPQEKGLDPRWLTHGAFECPPNDARPTWLYVSSGLSNAWEDDSPNPDGWSGLGCEFVIETPQQSRWALFLLQRMVAFQISLAAGRFPVKPVLGVWDRLPLRSSIDGKASKLTFVLLTPATRFSEIQHLASGKFEFLQFVGMTEDEAAFARERGSDVLYGMLLETGAAPVTDAGRCSILG
jgi:hypothetical protein